MDEEATLPDMSPEWDGSIVGLMADLTTDNNFLGVMEMAINLACLWTAQWLGNG